jgi:hypothetical protein
VPSQSHFVGSVRRQARVYAVRKSHGAHPAGSLVFVSVLQKKNGVAKRGGGEERTRHLAYPLAYAPTHAHDADLPERILVKPLGDELARVLEREVEPRRTHVAVRHRRREVQQEDEMADDRAAYRCSRREKPFFTQKNRRISERQRRRRHCGDTDMQRYV